MGVSLGYILWHTLSSFFVEPLQQEFGWSRGDIALANSAAMISGLFAPLLGRIVDRIGAKPVAIFGVVMSALTYLALSQMNGSLAYYYVMFFFLTMSGMATTGLTYGRILVGTFKKSRGTSLAMIRVGVACSQTIMPVLIFPVIAEFGSTGGFLVLGAINAFIMLPVIIFFVPGRSFPKGMRAPAVTEDAPSRWRLLFQNRKVITICIAATFHTAPIYGLLSQLKPIGVAKGLSSMEAAGAVSALGVASLIGALVAGIFVDRVWAPAVAFVMSVIPAIGCFMLVLLGNDVPLPLFYLSVILIGIGMGGESDVLGYMVARYFGLKDYATIAGLASLLVTMGIAVSASLIGRAYDAFGNYQMSLIVAGIFVAFAGVAYLMMGKYPHSSEG